MLIIFFAGLSIAFGIMAAPSTTTDKQVRDSVFATLRKEPVDSIRMEAMAVAFQKYIGQDWSIELTEAIRILARKTGNKEAELKTYYNQYLYYSLRDKKEKIAQCLKDVKLLSYRYGLYENYFQIWSASIKSQAALGSTEAAIVEIEQMKREADSLGYAQGVVIANIALVTSLHHANKQDEATELIYQILKSDGVSRMQKGELYQYLSNIYLRKGDFLKAEKCLDERKREMEYIVKENPTLNLAASLIGLEAGYCKVFLAMPTPDTRKLKFHLDEMEKLKGDAWSVNSYISYYVYLAGYYYCIGDLENSYKYYDLAKEKGKDTPTTFMISVREMKGQCAKFYKDYKVAAESYRDATLYGNSINQKIIETNEEARRASFNIRKALLDHSTYQKQTGILKVWALVVLLIVLVAILWYAIYTNRILRQSAKEIEEAWTVVNSANKMKEIFLRNITNEIKEPVDSVLDCAEVLASNKELNGEERKKFAATIKKNSGLLISLVSGVLDLSRLEAGMMRFVVEECDLVELCCNAKIGSEVRDTNRWQHTFRTECQYIKVNIDRSWFNRVLLFALSTPDNCNDSFEVDYTLTTREGYACVEVKTHPSLLYVETQQQRINHDINRIYLETFGGSYEVTDDRIVIHYPLM